LEEYFSDNTLNATEVFRGDLPFIKLWSKLFTRLGIYALQHLLPVLKEIVGRTWRISRPEDIELLQGYADTILQKITETAHLFPWPLVRLLKRTCKLALVWQRKGVEYNALTNMVFLRFFNNNIIFCDFCFPSLKIETDARKALTYVAKVIQTTVVVEGSVTPPAIKEFLNQILANQNRYEVIIPQKEFEKLQCVVAILSTIKKIDENEKRFNVGKTEMDVVLGYLTKCSEFQNLEYPDYHFCPSVEPIVIQDSVAKPIRTPVFLKFMNLPSLLASWSNDNVQTWLKMIGMKDQRKHLETVNGVDLIKMDSINLKILGCTNMANRKKLMSNIEALRLSDFQPYREEHIFFWRKEEVIYWLQAIDCEKHIQDNILIKYNTGPSLLDITSAELLEMGMIAIGMRKVFLQNITKLVNVTVDILVKKGPLNWNPYELALYLISQGNNSLANHVVQNSVFGKDLKQRTTLRQGSTIFFPSFSSLESWVADEKKRREKEKAESRKRKKKRQKKKQKKNKSSEGYFEKKRSHWPTNTIIKTRKKKNSWERVVPVSKQKRKGFKSLQLDRIIESAHLVSWQQEKDVKDSASSSSNGYETGDGFCRTRSWSSPEIITTKQRNELKEAMS